MPGFPIGQAKRAPQTLGPPPSSSGYQLASTSIPDSKCPGKNCSPAIMPAWLQVQVQIEAQLLFVRQPGLPLNNPMNQVLHAYSSLSRVQLFATPWTIARQAPLSMGILQAKYWSGLPFPSPINPLLVIQFENIFSHSVDRLLIMLMFPLVCRRF